MLSRTMCVAAGAAAGILNYAPRKAGIGWGRADDRLPLRLPRVHAAESSDYSSLSTGSSTEPSLAGESRTAQVLRYGFPSYDTLRTFDDFVLSYDRRNRVPAWVFEHLTPERVARNATVDRNKCYFSEDNSVHHYFRALNADYKGSGFDRGHMAAAGNHRQSQNAMGQTFTLSNMAPQVGKGFNRDKWNELEQHVRHLARHAAHTYVCTGPLYLPRKLEDGHLYVIYRVIGSNHVAVPTHYFKVVLTEKGDGSLSLDSYVMPNERIDDATPVKSFMVPLESIERAAGFLIFEKLPRNKVTSVNGKRS